ncbi:MAG TPA: glucose-1-phosphate cytidylyltransferase [Bacteroidales bacterium]|jgi:glucose-1-phosphate cytidylyltransferase|nr:glucose-1-phosphate cytidylyltransferase [Bacteroidales bacterium]HOF16889.1 glucose-1-phosphate cytidylyltransferase [Bacteroidales bacterium]HON20235.1 glucose-1-phosphate cytidylyltransferase [Bacteroidales bacterium]HOR82684.1 glucose-1-phosphate cytidylyltransferase [Bacteroidales bacterium]HPJ91870.1 glucose-1-phosphate cytidylyltransferase [Bacteroidales bacterium]
MKVVILAGGYGTRLSEHTHLIPKPMVEIGGKPILWHIMKIYSHYGFNEFIICCGYKQYVIKEYFSNYFRHNCDITVDLSNNSIEVLDNHSENWKVTIIDTGLDTMTGGRIKRIQKYIGDHPFLLTYGDGVADVNIRKTIEEHNKSKKHLSMMAYQPGGHLGVLDIQGDEVVSFIEKPQQSGTWINAGFFVCEPQVFDYLEGDHEMFERQPMSRMMEKSQIHAFKHTGFWKPMDTLRDLNELNKLWEKGNAPWKVW